MALPKRKPPAGLETAASRGPNRYHRQLDSSCQSIEMEEIDHWRDGCFQPDLYDRMEWMPLADLHKHYPELVFARLRSKTKPKGWDIVVGSAPRYCVARWRTASDPL